MLSNYRLRESRERQAREEAEAKRQEAEKLQALVAPMTNELQDAYREHERTAKVYWSQPVSRLAEALQRGDAQAYIGVEFTKTPEPRPREGKEECVAAHEEIQRRFGYVLSPVGRQRVILMAVHQCMAQSASLSHVVTYVKCFEKLLEWGAFEASGTLEIGYDESKKEYVSEPVEQGRKLSADDLESIDTGSRTGAELAHQIVADAVWGRGGEAENIFRQFIAHVARTFHYDLSPEDQREIVQWFTKNNRSFLDAKAYDQCKVNLVRRGILPATLLTEDERLCMSLETSQGTDYETRRKLKQTIIAARQ